MSHAMMLSFLLLAGSTGGVPGPDAVGPYAVGYTSFLLTDASRPGDGGLYAHRPIPVSVWYPADRGAISDATPPAVYPLDPLYGGHGSTLPPLTSDEMEKFGIDPAYQDQPVSGARPFPVLIFSPGWGGPSWSNASLCARIASHGFVVAQPYHFGDHWWKWEPVYDRPSVALFNRPRDLSFVLDELLRRNAAHGEGLYGAIRPDRVAAGGWSFGGYAAITLAAGDDDICDTPFGDVDSIWGMGPCALPPRTATPPDGRFKLIVTLDASSQVLHFEELARVTVPAMGMGEEWSTLAADPDPAWASWQARQHAAFQGSPNYRVDVFGTIHQSFSDLCANIPMLGDLGIWNPSMVRGMNAAYCTDITPPAESRRLVDKYLVAFLKTNLAGVADYQDVLTPGYALTSEPLIEFFVTEKANPAAVDQDWPSFFLYFMHQSGSEQARAEKNPKIMTHAVQRPWELPRTGGGR